MERLAGWTFTMSGWTKMRFSHRTGLFSLLILRAWNGLRLERKVREKIDDQIYRSLYEFVYAYEQIERERSARFGDMTDRKVQFEYLLRDALKDDEIVGLERTGSSLELIVGNILGEQSITTNFP